MADWRAFATGFLERHKEITDERKEEAKEFETEQRESAARNAATISRRRAYADRVTGYADYLAQNGVTDAQFQATLATSPQAVEALVERVQTAVEMNDGRPLGASEVDALITMPAGFTPLDISNEEFVRQSFGFRTDREAPAAEEFSFWDRISGGAEMGQARERLRRTPYMDGMTIEEINEAAMRADYESLIPGTFTAIGSSTRDRYGIEQSDDFTSSFELQYNRVLSSDDMNDAQTGNSTFTPQELLENRLGGRIEFMIEEYGEAFLLREESYLRGTMGNDYVDALIERYINPEEEEPTGQPEPAPVPEPAPAQGEPVIRQPEVSIETPAAPAVPTTNVPDADMPSPEEAVTPSGTATEAPDATTPEGAAEGRETPEGYVLTGTDGVDYTYEDWQGLTRTQRETAGLPTSLIGAQISFRRFQAGLGMPPAPEGREGSSAGRRDTRPEIEDDSETNADGSRSRRAVNARTRLVRDYGVDEYDISLISDRATDIQRFALERGVTNREQLEDAIDAYVAETGINPPEDVAFVAAVLFQNLQQSGQIQQ